MEETNKKSKLCFDMRIARKLLKMNGEWKYCPFCGTLLSEGCDCHKNIIIDLKKKRETENETIAVFDNNDNFKNDYDSVVAEVNKKEPEDEQLTFDSVCE